MRAVGHCNVTRKTARLSKPFAKDVDEAGVRSGGANKALTVGEATEANGDM